MKIFVSLLTGILLFGCASVNMLPTTVNEVDFDSPEGKTGWSKYEHVETFHGYTTKQIYEALKVGFGESGFSLRLADKSKGVVIGEHGITLHDWNVIAGAYFKEDGDATVIKIIIEGSKDTGISGDVTGDGWTGKILGATRRYLNDTYQSVLKVNRDDMQE